MGDRLKGKVAIVTGAGRGIGRCHALALAAEGAAIVVNDLGVASDGSGTDSSPAQQVANEIIKAGGEAIASYGNVTKLEDCQKTVQEAVDKWNRVDILINNAGVLRDRMVFNMSAEEWDIVIKTHLYGHFNCIRAAASEMRRQHGGFIVNTSSESGLGQMGQANYSSAKEGIVGLTRTVARDLGRYGIICNAIRPRAGTRMTMNESVQAAWSKSGGSGLGAATGETLEEYLPPPEYVSPFVVFLCTDVAAKANINGRTFLVVGGKVSLYSEPELTKTITKDWQKNGPWTLDELIARVPKELAQGLVNPSPPKEEKKK
ncbi:MAG: SDR family NAD(P)-dependent oxidoreductase [Dehalococcoidia bacterium]|jgi:NAD(P)-dependent dehydrogenase (short-subunit alcohol dehydrogenase family)